jgi:hypothetical protein
MRNINLAMIVVLAITISKMPGILASANTGHANTQSKIGGSSSGVCLNNRYG